MIHILYLPILRFFDHAYFNPIMVTILMSKITPNVQPQSIVVENGDPGNRQGLHTHSLQVM